jgi:N-succinyldiaminopimelate aminotransferase
MIIRGATGSGTPGTGYHNISITAGTQNDRIRPDLLQVQNSPLFCARHLYGLCCGKCIIALLSTASPVAVNPFLDQLQPYPFEKLRALFAGATPPDGLAPISLGLGEPRHPTPAFIREALTAGLGGLANYPATAGGETLRQAIAGWLEPPLRRAGAGLGHAGAAGERLARSLFAFAQAVIDPRAGALVRCPNPFYQIYEGAALPGRRRPLFRQLDPARNFAPDFASVPADWARVQLLYVCSPGNPTGAVLSLDDWKRAVRAGRPPRLRDRRRRMLFRDLFRRAPPLGALEAAHQLGRSAGLARLIVFSSLSKRSNVPGMRSGFVAGDAAVLKKFLLYRTYCGGAMSPPVQAASIAAWNDETTSRTTAPSTAPSSISVTPLLAEVMDVALPDAGFYLWADVAHRPVGHRVRPRPVRRI